MSITKKQLKEKYKDEQVFIVPFNETASVNDKFSEVNLKNKSVYLKSFDPKGRYVFRYDAEYNPSFQQIIPYAIIKKKNENKYFVAKRIAGDARLLKQMSIGFGGHINICDGTSNIIINCLKRELDEELNISYDDKNIEFIGHVRDLTSPTSDHLGLVFIIEVDEVSIKEDESLIGEWQTMEELEKNYFSFEGWSKYVIDHLYLQTQKKG